ncbi:MAG: hypothetical protein IPM49_16145 [Flavobacteriales bacterium]|nr:hypothetical protein [Flavobacteriales bacterium]
MTRTLLVALLTVASTMASATIHRVNNAGIAADFTTLQDAHDAALPGDTLHLEPSGLSYGGCTFIKPLVVIGPGYFLNLNAGLQASSASAITGGLLFEAGSEGCVVSGLDVQGQTTVKASLVRVERCRFSGGGMNLNIAYNFAGLNLTGVVVNGCHVANNVNVGAGNSTVSDLTISNTYARQFNFATSGSTSGEMLHCVAVGAGSTALFGGSGMIISNSIFDGSVTPGASTYQNNLFSQAPVPATNGNQVNVDMSTVFVGGAGDAQFALAPGSPALGAGTGGVDCGLFAGAEPYQLSGLPPVPAIFQFTAPTSTDQGTPLPVTLGSRTNN